MKNQFRHQDTYAAQYESAKEQYEQDPGAAGRHEAVEASWDAMVDAVEEAGHDVDDCPCRSCGFYRAGTE